jgi:hypothetical protein
MVSHFQGCYFSPLKFEKYLINFVMETKFYNSLVKAHLHICTKKMVILMFISIDIFFWMDNDGVEDIVDKVKVMG